MIFKENMEYTEAVKAFHASMVGKSRKEQEEIKEEFKRMIPKFVEKEVDGSSRLTSYII